MAGTAAGTASKYKNYMQDLQMIFISVLLAAPLVFFFASIILFGISKLFKIDKARFSYSMLIVFLIGLSSTLIKFLFSYFGSGASSLFSSLAALLVSFYIFYKLFEHYYKIDWKKSLYMYLLYLAGMAVIAVLIVVSIIFSFPWQSNPT